MFENMSHLALQHYWWFIISLLAALLVFLMFVQGGQSLLKTLSGNELERKILINSLGRKWEFTFTTLVTFGGAFFASFPLFYATSFGGAYWVWMIILFAFMIQAVSYEFRTKAGNFLGAKTYETFLLINGLFGTTLIGVAVGSMFTGSLFYLDDMNSSLWKGAAGGLELAFDLTRYATWINLSLGMAVFFLSRLLGMMYFANNVDDENIMAKIRIAFPRNTVLFLFFFLFFLVNILVRKGFAYDPGTGEVFMERFKYLNNLLEMPVVLIVLVAGIGLVLLGIWRTYAGFEKHGERAVWFTGSGTVLTVLSLFLVLGYNNTAFYPSVYDLQSSLTIQNASSSKFTLTIMSYVSLMVPFVLAYIWYAWRAINKVKIDAGEMESDTHSY